MPEHIYLVVVWIVCSVDFDSPSVIIAIFSMIIKECRRCGCGTVELSATYSTTIKRNASIYKV